MLRDRIVFGVRDKKLQKKMLETDSLTCESAIKAARAAEASEKQSKGMNKRQKEESVDE